MSKQIHISDTLHEELKRVKDARGVGIQWLAERFIRAGLNRYAKGKKHAGQGTIPSRESKGTGRE